MDSKVLLLGGAVAVWWFYFRTPAAATPVATGSTPTTPATPVTPAAPVIPAPVQFQNRPASLDLIYAAMLAAKNAHEGTLPVAVDTWNYYLNSVLQGGGAPDPMPLFSAPAAYGPSFDRSMVMSPSQFWSVMSPALAQQRGLTGLGFFGRGFREMVS